LEDSVLFRVMDNQNTQPTVSIQPAPLTTTEPAPAPAPETPPPQPPVVTAPHAKGMIGKSVLVLLVAILCIIVAGVGGYAYANNKAKTSEAGLNSQIAGLQSNSHQLPAGSTKVSDCIPDMGFHYLPKGSDPLYGPFVLVNKEGKVIGLEYMASADMYTPIPNTNPPVQLIEKNSPLFGWKFDHIEFSHLPLGHEGFMRDHIDIHLFTVTADQEKQACV